VREWWDGMGWEDVVGGGLCRGFWVDGDGVRVESMKDKGSMGGVECRKVALKRERWLPTYLPT